MIKTNIKQREFMLSSELKCIVLFGSTIENNILKTKSSSKWLKIVQVENYEVIR